MEHNRHNLLIKEFKHIQFCTGAHNIATDRCVSGSYSSYVYVAMMGLRYIIIPVTLDINESLL